MSPFLRPVPGYRVPPQAGRSQVRILPPRLKGRNSVITVLSFFILSIPATCGFLIKHFNGLTAPPTSGRDRWLPVELKLPFNSLGHGYRVPPEAGRSQVRILPPRLKG